LIPIATAVTTGYGVPGLKAALQLAGYVGGSPRPPLHVASDDAVAAIRGVLPPVQEFL